MKDSSDASSVWLVSFLLCPSNGASGMEGGQATWTGDASLVLLSKSLLEAGVLMHPGTVLDQTIPELHLSSLRRTFVNSARLESMGSVQAMVELVELCSQSSTF